MRIETHNLHGTGTCDHEVYDMPPSPDHNNPYWGAVTDVPCPVDGCDQTVLWYEAGYVPGYRVCMAAQNTCNNESFDHKTIRHRFLAKGNTKNPVLVRDHAMEEMEG